MSPAWPAFAPAGRSAIGYPAVAKESGGIGMKTTRLLGLLLALSAGAILLAGLAGCGP